MKTILLVEDNPHIMNINANAFKLHGYKVLKAENAQQCLSVLQTNEVHLIILDIMLPDGNGVELCRQLKKQYDIPVLFLSALGENEDIVAGLRAGGDDYLSKPYDLEVLFARAEARLRAGREKRFISFGNLKLDTSSMCGYVNGNDLLLTQKEFLVLLVLVRKEGSVVSKEELYRQVWGNLIGNDVSALYTTVSRLKKKLNAAGADVTISISRMAGYSLKMSEK